MIVVLHADLLPLDVLSQSHVVPEERVGHAASVKGLALLENDAGRHLLPHPIARRLIKGLAVDVALEVIDEHI